MGTFAVDVSCYLQPKLHVVHETSKRLQFSSMGSSIWRHFRLTVAATHVEEAEKIETGSDRPNFRWIEIGSEITEAQKRAISHLPQKMTKRCKALMRQIICFSPEKGKLSDLLAAWVRIMKPRRADWLSVLKELRRLDHPFYPEVAELALLEQSFEANVRDYTKIIHFYGSQNRIHDAENTFLTMKKRGISCNQITLTTMATIYSKAGNLNMAEEIFEEIKLLGEPIDKRSFGSMVMAYVRAERPDLGESVLQEMDAEETYAGSEVYKALLRAYSVSGDAEGAQRVFDSIQLAGITPDAKLCGLLINAYQMAGQSQKARTTFENMRKAGISPSDKCIALILTAYEKENALNTALKLLADLERDGVVIGKEASKVLVTWFRRLGVVEEVEDVLREYAAMEMNS